MANTYTEVVDYDTIMTTDWVAKWVTQAQNGALTEWEEIRRNENLNMWITAGKAAELASTYVKVIEALVTNVELRDQRGIVANLKRETEVEAHQARGKHLWHSVEVAERSGSIYEMFLRSWPRPRTIGEQSYLERRRNAAYRA